MALELVMFVPQDENDQKHPAFALITDSTHKTFWVEHINHEGDTTYTSLHRDTFLEALEMCINFIKAEPSTPYTTHRTVPFSPRRKYS